jgi:hypothetical protein
LYSRRIEGIRAWDEREEEEEEEEGAATAIGDELHVPKKNICFLSTSFGACDADSVQFCGCFRYFRDFCHLRTLLLYLFLIALSAGMLDSCDAPVTCVFLILSSLWE